MKETDDNGVCRFCLKTYSCFSMEKHLIACNLKKKADEKLNAENGIKNTIYGVKISGSRPYWLYIEILSKAKLKDLDKILRKIWLECCYHFSEFGINRVRYVSYDSRKDQSDDSKTMNFLLDQVLGVNDKFNYRYDYRDTTSIKGQIIYKREGTLKDNFKILARNNPPTFECIECGSKAVWVCLECKDFYCEKCLMMHLCEDDNALPVVNSPRIGVCAYTGEFDFDDFNLEKASVE